MTAVVQIQYAGIFYGIRRAEVVTSHAGMEKSDIQNRKQVEGIHQHRQMGNPKGDAKF